MPRRSVTRPSSPLLPFQDNLVSSSNPSPEQRPPTAFISYSHETPEHNERVEQLAIRLRADGIDCEIDSFQFSPPEGWPSWMLRQLQGCDFCIVVCTETYARRAAGQDASGAGKGVMWEARGLRQILYESGRNDGVIPIVFDLADVNYIPLELKNATYYDLSAADGYTRLYRALTHQPLVERRTLGAVRRLLPRLAPSESPIVALLGLCRDPVPLEVIARGVGQPAKEVETTAERLVTTNVATIEDGSARLVDRSAQGITDISDEVVGSALGAMLDFVGHKHRNHARAQMMNAVDLARAADIRIASAHVSRTFRVLQSLLKSSGNKHLVLDVARRSIAASKVVLGRGSEQVKDEAVAAICGVSWVYQRTGRLAEALVQAQHSLELGRAIRWDRNTAFCQKCLGRLKRMESEAVQDGQQRATLLEASVTLLLKAIDSFTRLQLELEVGDCYSLLARTYLVAGKQQAARDAIREADQRLVEPATKDYLDLRIVEGDLLAHSNLRSAESVYTEVLAESDDDDAQKSEIFARAYLHRGKVRAALGEEAKALADFQQAAKIWDALGDPAVDSANWEIERTASWVDRDVELLLRHQPVGVRVRVAQMVRDGAAERQPATSQRARLPETYLRALIRNAREQLTVERPTW